MHARGKELPLADAALPPFKHTCICLASVNSTTAASLPSWEAASMQAAATRAGAVMKATCTRAPLTHLQIATSQMSSAVTAGGARL